MAKLVLAFEGKILRSFPLEGGELAIGRSPEAEIQVNSIRVAERHARVVRDASGEWRLLALSSKNPVLVNHIAVNEQTLAHGDILQLGDYSLTFAADPVDFIAAAAAPPPPREEGEPSSFLQIVNGPSLGRVIPLRRALTRVGLHGSDSVAVARRSDGYYLSHLEGTIPPEINGDSIGERAVLLQDGDQIAVGGLQLQFHVE